MKPKPLSEAIALGLFVAAAGASSAQPLSISTLAGSALPGQADGYSSNAKFDWPGAIAAGQGGTLCLADVRNGTLRTVTPEGTVTTVAGSAGDFGNIDGSAGLARFFGPQGLASDANHNIYVADTANCTIRKLDPEGQVSTWAGSPGVPGSADGPGSSSEFNLPQGIACDPSGNLYVADTMNHTIRRVTPGPIVSTLAGSVGNAGGADGTNGRARFNRPVALAVSADGNLFVSDSFNHTVRKVTPSGSSWAVTTVAGFAGVWGKADGTNRGARFFQPHGLAIDSGGNIYVADSGNHALRKITPMGDDWVVTTVAGLPGDSGNADGAGVSARLSFPSALTIDGAGRLYLSDSANHTLKTDHPVPPWLTISRPGDSVVLSWPIAAAAYALESGSELPAGRPWTSITEGLQTNGANVVFTGTNSGTRTFYRLRSL